MSIKYYKLFDILNRRNITKTKMRIDIGISTKTLARISAHEHVSMDVLEKLCIYLGVQPGDLMEIEQDDTSV